ncbi:MAG TPA: carbon-nitrogen hydrolase family protein [Dehalococcoidia bacterium]
MARRVRVACLQLPARDLEDAAAALEHALRRIGEAAAGGARLVVLPECTYPAYFLRSREAYDAAGLLPDAELLTLLGDRARRHGIYLAAGVVLTDPESGRLHNAGVLFGPDGRELARHAKSFLWHFDTVWFQPGGRFPVVETEVGRLGMLICADGRQPEVARSLAVQGAQVLLDLTAWVTWGTRPQEFQSPHCTHLMPVRALENGVWVVAADKVGVEADSIVYTGRSGVIDPWGRWTVQGSPDGDEVVFAEIDPDAAPGPPAARRPVLYADLTRETAELPAMARLREPLVPDAAAGCVAAVQVETARPGAAVEAVRRLYCTLRGQGAQVVVAPTLVEPDGGDALSALRELTRREGGALVLGLREERDGAAYLTGYLLEDGRVRLVHRATHALRGAPAEAFDLGDAPCPVVETAAGSVGLLVGAEGLVPEVSRSLMLRGAEFLLWTAPARYGMLDAVARTRADENRVYVAAAAPAGGESGALVVGPQAQVLAVALAGRPMGVTAQVNRALTRWKDMAPGTNVLTNRLPGRYGPLAAP